jgi:hypothetical protein
MGSPCIGISCYVRLKGCVPRTRVEHARGEAVLAASVRHRGRIQDGAVEGLKVECLRIKSMRAYAGGFARAPAVDPILFDSLVLP